MDNNVTPQPVLVTTNQQPHSPLIYKLLCVLLIIGIAIGLVLWKPWEANVKASDRTISVTGNATITATPDEYVFSPSYDLTGNDKQTALNDLSTKSNQIVTQLKSLGVASSAIQINSSGYSNGYYIPVKTDGSSTTYILSFTIKLTDSSLAQKVQDYLLTTSPTGDVSPQVNFSSAKQKSLQDQGRNQAEQDARSKADQSAKNLGFKVIAVKSVVDGDFNNTIASFAQVLNGNAQASPSTPTLPVQPGQNDLPYSVNVVYFIH